MCFCDLYVLKLLAVFFNFLRLFVGQFGSCEGPMNTPAPFSLAIKVHPVQLVGPSATFKIPGFKVCENAVPVALALIATDLLRQANPAVGVFLLAPK